MKIKTYTGKEVDILNPEPDMINLYDIARSLSRICRFNGHTKRFYSVAEHSFLGSTFVDGLRTSLIFLLHDAAEAYVGDLIRPIKYAPTLEAFIGIENTILECIYMKYLDNYPTKVELEEVKRIDDMMLQAEGEFFMGWKSANQQQVIFDDVAPDNYYLTYVNRLKTTAEILSNWTIINELNQKGR